MSKNGVTPWLIRLQNENMHKYCRSCRHYDYCPCKPTLSCTFREVEEALEKMPDFPEEV